MVYNNSLFQSNFKKNPIYSPSSFPTEETLPSQPKLTMQEEKTKGLRPLLNRLGLFLASFAASPFPSLYQRVEFKRAHRSYNMSMAWNKSRYGEDLVGLTRNISKDEHHIDKKEKLAAKELMKTCKGLLKSDEFSHLELRKNSKFKPFKNDGICSGVRTYVASKILYGTPIEAVIDELDKGAPVKAAANQYGYRAISPKPLPISQLFVQIIDSLNNVASSASHNQLHMNPRAIQVALFLYDNDFRTSRFKEAAEASLKTMNNQQDATFIQLIKSAVPKGDREYAIRDLEQFQQSVQAEINNDFNKKIKKDPSPKNLSKQLQIRESYTESLQWTVSLLEMKNAFIYTKKANRDYATSKITNPLHREIVQSLDDEGSMLTEHQVVAAANGIKFSSLQRVMGNSTLMKDDHSYLLNIDKLDPGVYGISIRTYGGAHAMFYQKNDDGSGYIIDPNGPQLFFKDTNHAIELLEKVIGTYRDPKAKSILAGPNDRHHQIVFSHIEKRDADS